ncbi:hypothetical protein D9M68_312030 [compost metagenome]
MLTACRFAQHGTESIAIENVVTQDQADTAIADELFANQERLGQSIRRWLLGVAEADTKLRTITQQLAEIGQVFRCGDNQDFAYSRQHQDRQWIIDHRLVIDRQ